MCAMDFEPSTGTAHLHEAMRTGLRENRFDPRGLYVTPRQAALWKLVAARHSPANFNPDFRRIYDDAFSRLTERMTRAGPVELVGLGGGTGEKETWLCQSLRKAGHEVRFAGIDVSEDLVREAAGRLVAVGAQHDKSLVCDLAKVEFIMPWLKKNCGTAPRVFTFFGLVPNFSPSQLGRILRGLLRSRDVLLASVHLVPVGKEETPNEILRGMKQVLPQYDNAETLAWLAEGLDAWNLREELGPPYITVSEIEKIPAFVGMADWKPSASSHLSSRCPEPLRIFQSLRHTSRSFEEFLRGVGLSGECLATTRCREEGIWRIRII